MVGSKLSIAGPNTVLNTTVAEELSQFADILESSDDFTTALNNLIKETIKNHKRIIFNGNNYSDEWVKEAEKRGLLNLKSTPESLPYLSTDKNIRMFEKFKIFSEKELNSRLEIHLEDYCKTISIEALTMLEMVKKDIFLAVSSYIKHLSETASVKKSLISDVNCDVEISIITKLSLLLNSLYKKTEIFENLMLDVKEFDDLQKEAEFCRNNIFIAMQEIRAVVDELEANTAEKYWPFPTYGDILFSVK
jgi:glutamine synthetase